MRVTVDDTLCQGHNRCSAVAPDLFVLDDHGFASAAADGTVPTGRREDAHLAADNCPELAILIEDDDA
jgi:ferredoxin